MERPENWNDMNENQKRAWQINNDPDFWDKDAVIEKGSKEEKKIKDEIEWLKNH